MVALRTQPPSRWGKGGTSVPPPANPMRRGALARISMLLRHDLVDEVFPPSSRRWPQAFGIPQGGLYPRNSLEPAWQTLREEAASGKPPSPMRTPRLGPWQGRLAKKHRLHHLPGRYQNLAFPERRLSCRKNRRRQCRIAKSQSLRLLRRLRCQRGEHENPRVG